MATRIGNSKELQRFLEDIKLPEEKKPDEFTSLEIHAALKAAGDKRSFNAIRCYLEDAEREGKYTRRKLLINGKWTYVYRKETTTQRSSAQRSNT
jgi:hypothetical protein